MYTALYFIGLIIMAIAGGFENQSIPTVFMTIGLGTILYAIVGGAITLGKKTIRG